MQPAGNALARRRPPPVVGAVGGEVPGMDGGAVRVMGWLRAGGRG